jgi:hypothetical protein
MTMKMTSDQRFMALYKEVRRLRERDGVSEDLGGLGFALKVHEHFNGKPNPRVEEALRNLEGAPFAVVAAGKVKELPDSGFKGKQTLGEGISTVKVDDVTPIGIKPPEFQS